MINPSVGGGPSYRTGDPIARGLTGRSGATKELSPAEEVQPAKEQRQKSRVPERIMNGLDPVLEALDPGHRATSRPENRSPLSTLLLLELAFPIFERIVGLAQNMDVKTEPEQVQCEEDNQNHQSRVELDRQHAYH